MGAFETEDSAGLSATFHFGLTDTRRSGVGLDELESMLRREQEFANTFAHIDPFANIVADYSECVTALRNYRGGFGAWDEQSRQHQFQPIKKKLEVDRTTAGYPLIDSESGMGIWLKELATQKPEYAVGAYNLLSGRSLNTSSADHLVGAIRAYEFLHVDDSAFGSRRTAEKQSISQLRNSADEVFRSCKERQETRLSEMEAGWSTQSEAYGAWYGDRQSELKSLFDDARSRQKALEKQYTELMTIKGPVKYWNQMAKSYRFRGMVWATLTGFVGLVAGSGVYSLIANPPDSFTHSLLAPDALAVKTVLLFATFVSFVAYLVRTTTRMALSAFHLESDAKERENLSMVYLAMIEVGKVTEQEKALIFQALFSRSDSGLLKVESPGPTLPGLSQLVR